MTPQHEPPPVVYVLGPQTSWAPSWMTGMYFKQANANKAKAHPKDASRPQDNVVWGPYRWGKSKKKFWLVVNAQDGLTDWGGISLTPEPFYTKCLAVDV